MPLEHKPLARVVKLSNAPGRAQELVECPFCHAETITYVWSRYGSGKRCKGRECSAILGGWFASRPAG